MNKFKLTIHKKKCQILIKKNHTISYFTINNKFYFTQQLHEIARVQTNVSIWF